MKENEFSIDDAFIAGAIILTTNENPTIKFNAQTKKTVFSFPYTKDVITAFQRYMAGSEMKIYADLVKSLRVEALKLKTKHS